MEELKYEYNGGRRKKKRPTGKLSYQALLHKAQGYVDRYGCASHSLREVLKRRVRKSREQPGFDAEQAADWIETVIRDLSAAGAIDDRRFARERARVLFERGFSTYRIRQKLSEKRIFGEVADEAIKFVTADSSNPDLEAGHAYAKRRRIGRYRIDDRDEMAQKDLAKIARAGFSYGIAKQVVFGSDDDDFEAGYR
jgi:regulatory protein